MTELNLDSYMSVLDTIKLICNDPLTTASDLQEKLDELAICVTNIDLDTDTMALPSTVNHLQKFIIVQNFIIHNTVLQSYICNLIEKRNKRALYDATNDVATQEYRNNYYFDTKEIKMLYETISENEQMNALKQVICYECCKNH